MTERLKTMFTRREASLRPGTVTIGRDSFPLVVTGDGPPILFLHGAPGDCRTWAPHHQLLSREFRCISYTQRGFGMDHWNEDGHRFGAATHAADLIKILMALKVGPVSLVAWSYSAPVALKALALRPDVFRSALLYEPGTPTYIEDKRQLLAFLEDAAAMFSPVQEAARGLDYEEAVRRLIDGSGGTGYFDKQDGHRRNIHLASARAIQFLLGADAFPDYLSAADVRSIKVPVCVAWGSDTRPMFSISSKACASLLPGGHEEIAGQGHLWPEEDPAGLSALVARQVAGAIADELNRPIGRCA